LSAMFEYDKLRAGSGARLAGGKRVKVRGGVGLGGNSRSVGQVLMSSGPGSGLGPEEFEELFAQYERRIFNLLLRLVGNYEDAADLASETFVRAMAAAGRFRGEAQPYTWLYRIAVNLAKNYFRSRSAQPQLEAQQEMSAEEPGQPSVQDLLEQRELQREVENALQSLPVESRALIVLRDLQGLSYQEIAEATESTLELVKSRLFRARTMLRQKLARYLLPEA